MSLCTEETPHVPQDWRNCQFERCIHGTCAESLWRVRALNFPAFLELVLTRFLNRIVALCVSPMRARRVSESLMAWQCRQGEVICSTFPIHEFHSISKACAYCNVALHRVLTEIITNMTSLALNAQVAKSSMRDTRN